MGKRIIQQRRGRGTSTYRAHSFRFAGKASYNVYEKDSETSGEVTDIIHSKGHSAPLMKVKYENGKEALIPAFDGVFIGKKITINQKENLESDSVEIGNAYLLKNIPEGTEIYNIELKPGDSGKIVKAGGSFARVISHLKGFTKIVLPSKKEKLVNSNCRAFIGQIGGAGRTEKPFMKAGTKFFEKKKKNKLYPVVSGVAMSAFDHPHGSTRSLRKGRPTIAPHNAPPGRKVGMLRPKHTGRNK
ncbi:MAG: 50S ribosomal protein L2 [Nanoarchaeota archaeon]|nr:50S ribosomal protein L2 [Nanoarchaeota archaeon]